jgi:peptide/nickel transport system substrate-binding protein
MIAFASIETSAVVRHALCVLAALLSILASSCSRTQTSNPGVLIFAGPGVEPDTLNPLLTQESDVSDFATLYSAVLFQIDDRGRLVPEIAATLPTRKNGGISADGLTITYHLRHGILWQDGAPLTAADVTFSYQAVVNPANNVSPRIGYDHIGSVSTPDKWTAVLHLKRPYAPIVTQFGNYPYYPLLPAHLLARYANVNGVPYNSLPIGAGPYEVVDWQRGDHITLKANPHYWRGVPGIKTLVFRFIPNPGTAANQLQTGELGAWFNVDPDAYEELAHASVPLTKHPLNDIHMLLLDLRDPILGDVRVRRAIQAALNRPLIIRSVVHGLGIPIDADQPAFSWAFSQPQDAIRYDPERAAALLDAAGWRAGRNGIRSRNGEPLELQLSGTTDVTAWQQLAALVQDALRRVGISASVKTFPAGEFFGPAQAGGVLESGKYQLAYDAHLLGDDPNDEQYLACNQFAPQGNNYVFWCNLRANRAISAALGTYDNLQRKRDYAIVQQEIARDVPFIPLWQVVRLDAFSRPLKNFSPSPSGSTFWNAWSWRLDSR